jgi:hypothetical protein
MTVHTSQRELKNAHMYYVVDLCSLPQAAAGVDMCPHPATAPSEHAYECETTVHTNHREQKNAHLHLLPQAAGVDVCRHPAAGYSLILLRCVLFRIYSKTQSSSK